MKHIRIILLAWWFVTATDHPTLIGWFSSEHQCSEAREIVNKRIWVSHCFFKPQ